MDSARFSASQSVEPTIAESLREIELILETKQDGLASSTGFQIVEWASRIFDGRNWGRSEMLLNSGTRISSDAWRAARSAARQCADGELLQHVLCEAHFLNHRYRVSNDVLIPRPETEVLVSCAIELLKKEKFAHTLGPERGAELGLGSGVISIELLAEFSTLKMDSSEISSRAARLAQENARDILGSSDAAKRLVILSGDSERPMRPFGSRGLQYDFIISNPPYLIRNSDEVTLEVATKEPEIALFAPEKDPLFFYRELSTEAGGLLRSGGWLFLEVPHERAREIRRIFERSEAWGPLEMYCDLNGRDRVLAVKFSQLKP